MQAMRVILGMTAAALALAGCDRKDAAPGSTATPAATATPTASGTAAPAGFTPPTSMSRADYGGKVERRFHKLDRNGDNKLERDELPPKRADKLLRKGDTNGDGSLDASEWSAVMLQKFDKRDVNHDGNLTSDEKGGRKGGKHRGGGRRDRGPDDGFSDDSDDVDNGF